jgi:DNA topoisomerase VI subunit B
LVILKELADNAIDEAEEAGVALSVTISFASTEVVVADRAGRGIDSDTVASIVDYTVRTSSREAYVSVTRGQQGNALQAILAMGFALDGERGETIIETRGVDHRIIFAVDPVRRVPEVKHEQGPSPVQIGVKTTIKWPERASSIVAAIKADLYRHSRRSAGSIRICRRPGRGTARLGSTSTPPPPIGRSGGRPTRPLPTGTTFPASPA